MDEYKEFEELTAEDQFSDTDNEVDNTPDFNGTPEMVEIALDEIERTEQPNVDARQPIANNDAVSPEIAAMYSNFDDVPVIAADADSEEEDIDAHLLNISELEGEETSEFSLAATETPVAENVQEEEVQQEEDEGEPENEEFSSSVDLEAFEAEMDEMEDVEDEEAIETSDFSTSTTNFDSFINEMDNEDDSVQAETADFVSESEDLSDFATTTDADQFVAETEDTTEEDALVESVGFDEDENNIVAEDDTVVESVGFDTNANNIVAEVANEEVAQTTTTFDSEVAESADVEKFDNFEAFASTDISDDTFEAELLSADNEQAVVTSEIENAAESVVEKQETTTTTTTTTTTITTEIVADEAEKTKKSTTVTEETTKEEPVRTQSVDEKQAKITAAVEAETTTKPESAGKRNWGWIAIAALFVLAIITVAIVISKNHKKNITEELAVEEEVTYNAEDVLVEENVVEENVSVTNKNDSIVAKEAVAKEVVETTPPVTPPKSALETKWSIKTPCTIISYGAFQNEAKAKKQVEMLATKGLPAKYYWMPDYEAGAKSLYKVVVGPFVNAQAAGAKLAAVKQLSKDAYVVELK